ncbi:transglycosylase domain-containing protein [Actinomycetospora straminea]|uniref:transglycosylase domain-containing protein n=1 Tax=Actinomycetospora straminea TaxID=663607 RepID=UPI002366162A|nr:transglycosylase domain-containing protein [Actinomycetospora straminea]MDD7934576.1 transglycosylase domain-containing protein [Actinomycetospora straminea]
MAGTHARSSGRRRAADVDTPDEDDRGTPAPAESRGAHAGAHSGRLDRRHLDSDYGDYVSARIAASPAPVSPPVGFPSAFSTGSFRSHSATGSTSLRAAGSAGTATATATAAPPRPDASAADRPAPTRPDAGRAESARPDAARGEGRSPAGPALAGAGRRGGPGAPAASGSAGPAPAAPPAGRPGSAAPSAGAGVRERGGSATPPPARPAQGPGGPLASPTAPPPPAPAGRTASVTGMPATGAPATTGVPGGPGPGTSGAPGGPIRTGAPRPPAGHPTPPPAARPTPPPAARPTPPPGPAARPGAPGRPGAQGAPGQPGPAARPGGAPGPAAPAGAPAAPGGPSSGTAPAPGRPGPAAPGSHPGGPSHGAPAPTGAATPGPGRPPGPAAGPAASATGTATRTATHTAAPTGTPPPRHPAEPEPATLTPAPAAERDAAAAPARRSPKATATMPAVDAPAPRGPGSGPLPPDRRRGEPREPDELDDVEDTDGEDGDDADDAGTTRAARPPRTATATGTATGTARAAARRGAAARTATRSRGGTGRPGTRSTTAHRSPGRTTAASETPRVPRGRVAVAVAAVLGVLAARIVGLPGGERLVAFGRQVRARVVLYLDGPHPDTLAPAALRWRRMRRTAYAGIAAMVAAPVLSLVVGWLFIPVPNADDAVESQLNTVSFADGTVLARIAPGEQGNRQKVGLEQVPPPVRSAVLSAEDRSFYSNSGFDVTGFGRAVWKNLTGGSGGGSTITQQYVKNAMVGDEYSLVRKYKELIISLKISQERSKDEILADYLNSIYFGRGSYGIQAASQAYFGRPVETLSPAEGALLAGVIQAPSKWDPAQNPDDALRRWNYVMDGMVAQGWLAPPDRATAQFPPTIPPRRVTGGVPDDDRGHIYSAVRDELRTLGIDQDALVTQGLHIRTTIQPEAQREAVEANRRQMQGQPENLRTATVSIDPRTGGILAYYGGPNGSGLDYAKVEKQAGSTFKPFVLLAALQQDPPIGISTEFDGRAIPGRTVRNVDGADCANCSLKRAMTLSNNVIFTALGNRVGPQAVAAAARQAGITQPMDDPNSGIALGNQETTAVDLASAYATFSNEGIYHRPHLVQRVTTASGEVLYDDATTQGEQRIDPRVARNVTEAMRDVPEYDGVSLQGGRQSAGKTGTVQSHVESQNNDAWFAGYTPSASTVVWVGTDDNTPIKTSDGRPVYGHGLPSEIWKTFMDDALEDTPKQSFGAFTPVAGTDPGDTAGQGDTASPSPSSSSAPSSSAAPTSTTAPPAEPAEEQPAEVPPAEGQQPGEDPAAAEAPAGGDGAAPAEGADPGGG